LVKPEGKISKKNNFVYLSAMKKWVFPLLFLIGWLFISAPEAPPKVFSAFLIGGSILFFIHQNLSKK